MKNARMLVVIALMSAVGQVANAQQLSERDQLHIAVQEICPVSGQKLGAHGPPIKVRIGEARLSDGSRPLARWLISFHSANQTFDCRRI